MSLQWKDGKAKVGKFQLSVWKIAFVSDLEKPNEWHSDIAYDCQELWTSKAHKTELLAQQAAEDALMEIKRS